MLTPKIHPLPIDTSLSKFNVQLPAVLPKLKVVEPVPVLISEKFPLTVVEAFKFALNAELVEFEIMRLLYVFTDTGVLAKTFAPAGKL